MRAPPSRSQFWAKRSHSAEDCQALVCVAKGVWPLMGQRGCTKSEGIPLFRNDHSSYHIVSQLPFTITTVFSQYSIQKQVGRLTLEKGAQAILNLNPLVPFTTTCASLAPTASRCHTWSVTSVCGRLALFTFFGPLTLTVFAV